MINGMIDVSSSSVLAIVNMVSTTITVVIDIVTIYSAFKMCSGLVDPKHQREAHP